MPDRLRTAGGRTRWAVRVLIASAYVEARGLATNVALFGLVTVQPVAFTLVTLLGARGPTPPDPGRVLLGVALIALWGSTMWTAALVMRNEKWQGSLVTLAHQPVDLRLVVLGKCAGAVAVCAVYIALSVGLTGALLRIDVSIAHAGMYVASIAAALVSVTVLGFALSCLFLLTRAAIRIVEAMTYPVFVLGGLLFPLDLLPEFTHVVAYGLSLYWGGVLAQGAVAGTDAGTLPWVMLAVTTAAYGVAGALAYRTVLQRAKEVGDLEFG